MIARPSAIQRAAYHCTAPPRYHGPSQSKYSWTGEEMTDLSPASILSTSLGETWDLEEETPDSHLWASPLGRFVAGIRDTSPDQRAMPLLAFFVARRALPCWQLYCDGSIPLDGVQLAELVLAGNADAAGLRQFFQPAIPTFRGSRIVDCRECDTSCAAASVAHMARFLVDRNPRDLAICLSAADIAFDQSPLVNRDHFRRWLIEVAAPAAMAHRSLSDEEAARFRAYTPAELVREREQQHDHPSEQPEAPQKRWYQFW
jgi:hypothetical protein